MSFSLSPVYISLPWLLCSLSVFPSSPCFLVLPFPWFKSLSYSPPFSVMCPPALPALWFMWWSVRSCSLHYNGIYHPGVWASKGLVSLQFVWPGLSKDVGLWAPSCLHCKQSQTRPRSSLWFQGFLSLVVFSLTWIWIWWVLFHWVKVILISWLWLIDRPVGSRWLCWATSLLSLEPEPPFLPGSWGLESLLT